MLVLIFNIGQTRCAIDSRRVIEVVPRVALRQLPRASDYVAGLFVYRGAVVPVIDLCQLAMGRPCGHQLSTRIVLVDYPEKDGGSRAVGLLAECVTETAAVREGALTEPEKELDPEPYPGKVVATEDTGEVRVIEIDRILPEEVYRHLFADCEESEVC